MTREKLEYSLGGEDEGGIEMNDPDMGIMRDNLKALLEEIPGGPPNIYGDPDEEIAVTLRHLKTLRSLLNTMTPREWENANKLKIDIDVLEKALKFLQKRKSIQEKGRKILNDPGA